jgi:hypothetical protein
MKNYIKNFILKKKRKHMKRKIYFVFGLIAFIFNLSAQDYPIKKIEAELSQAEKDFEIAKKMFSPWYGGRLLTGSGNVLPPGYVNINPQVQVTDYFAAYNNSRKSIPMTSIIEVNPTLSAGVGIVNRVDINVLLAWDYQAQSDVSFFGWQDNNVKLSFALAKEGVSMPAIKFSIKEIFPTGKYKNLDPEKANVQGLGDGAYKTEFGFNVSKVVWWVLTHPMMFRLSLNYGIASKIKVKNFNSYGGGFGTDGKIDFGNYFKGNAAYEISVTQKIVWAIDVVYEYFGKRTFKGYSGLDADGFPAIVGGPSGDKLSLAPAVEYNFTPDISLISGLWFTILGRNKLDFIAGIISLNFGF